MHDARHAPREGVASSPHAIGSASIRRPWSGRGSARATQEPPGTRTARRRSACSRSSCWRASPRRGSRMRRPRRCTRCSPLRAARAPRRSVPWPRASAAPTRAPRGGPGGSPLRRSSPPSLAPHPPPPPPRSAAPRRAGAAFRRGSASGGTWPRARGARGAARRGRATAAARAGRSASPTRAPGSSRPARRCRRGGARGRSLARGLGSVLGRCSARRPPSALCLPPPWPRSG
mmetsp:Transcript_10666/g.25929  ORF Transcript_10666/g.25929 Transcript_10666/m.25929 type:complete len:232 (-) Transcript_10666:1324-2019(-)